MQKQLINKISAATLPLMAMAFMLCESIYFTFAQDSMLLQLAGNLVYPILAFMTVEGYFCTTDVKEYAKRLLILAVISEIPFNLLCSSIIIYPFRQSVLWSLLLGIVLVHLNRTVNQNGEKWFSAVTMAMSFVIAVAAGYILIGGYCGTAVVMVLSFYLFRGTKLWCLAGQILALYYANVMLMEGETVTLNILGNAVVTDTQIFTLLSLVPIWVYSFKRYVHRLELPKMCFAFYPLQMLIIAMMFING